MLKCVDMVEYTKGEVNRYFNFIFPKFSTFKKGFESFYFFEASLLCKYPFYIFIEVILT